MATFTNPDGSSADCNIVSTVPGEVKLVETKEADCTRDFTCEYVDTGWQTNVSCPGKMKVYYYEQDVTNNWSCTMRADGCTYYYTYSEKVTNKWTENGTCVTENGRSCCPDYSLPIGGPDDWERPDGWPDGPIIVGPDEPNPFK